MKSGELAQITGLSVDTLHYYEKKGLLQPQSKQENGYRHYGPDAVQRVNLIQRALQLGFTLDELVPILKERDAGGAPCKKVRNLAAQKLAAIDAKLEALTELRLQFIEMIDDWDVALSSANGSPARLLDRLPNVQPTSVRPKKPTARSLR